MSASTPPNRPPHRVRAGISRRPGKHSDRGRADQLTIAERRRLRRDRLLGKRRPGPRRHHRRMRIALICLTVLSTLALAGIGTLFVGYNTYLNELPDAATLAGMEPALDSHVYARDGTLLAVIHSQGSHHVHASLDQISRVARRATIAIEDRHFYENQSWDLPRIVKAGWGNLRHDKSAGGASTITEQLAKIAFLEANGTVSYKIKEFILGTQIEANFGKDQILEMYLNRVPYGNHAVGIETAAQLYFHKHAKDLDLAEGAMLAGLPNSPTVLNPLVLKPGEKFNHAAKSRQIDVLQAMVYNGDISQQESDLAQAEPLIFHSWVEAEPNVAPDFVQYLVNHYLPDKFGDSFRNPGGWDIYTSLDLGKQAVSELTVNRGVAANIARYNMHDGAMVSIDPKTGEILTMIGTWNYDDPGVGQLNMAARPLQPGSTIKLFTYTAAIASRNYTMATQILDAPLKFPNGYTPHNYDNHFHGYCALAACLGNSFNIPAVETAVAIGIPYITSLEIAAGLTSLQDVANNRPRADSYAATLGALYKGISPLELASGAATIADLGIHHDPAPVLKIVDTVSAQLIYRHDPTAEARRVVPENVAYIMNEITSNNNNRLRAFPAHSALLLDDRRVSAKTGTTDSFMSNWTVGWTPDIVTSVWVGNPDPSCLRDADRAGLQTRLHRGDNIEDPFTPRELAGYGLQPKNDHCGHLEGTTGIDGAAPIWHAYMAAVNAPIPPHWYARPSDVVEIGTGDDGQFFLPGTGPGTGKPICPTSCPAPPPPAPVAPAPPVGTGPPPGGQGNQPGGPGD